MKIWMPHTNENMDRDHVFRFSEEIIAFWHGPLVPPDSKFPKAPPDSQFPRIPQKDLFLKNVLWNSIVIFRLNFYFQVFFPFSMFKVPLKFDLKRSFD